MTPLLPETTVVNTDRSSVLAGKHGQEISSTTGEAEKTFREELDKQQSVRSVATDKASVEKASADNTAPEVKTSQEGVLQVKTTQDSDEKLVEITIADVEEAETDILVTVIDDEASTGSTSLESDNKIEDVPLLEVGTDEMESASESVLQVIHAGKPFTMSKPEEVVTVEQTDLAALHDSARTAVTSGEINEDGTLEQGGATSRILELMTSYRIKPANNTAPGPKNNSMGQTVSDISLTSKVTINSSVGEQGTELKPVNISSSELSFVNQNQAATVSKPLTATQLANALSAKSQRDNAPLSVSFSELLNSSAKSEPGVNLNEYSSFQSVSNLTPASQSPLSTTMRMQIDVKVGQPQWAQALAERTANLAGQNLQFAEIQLDPPELGPLQVKVAVSQDHATVSFASAHQSVRDGIDQSIFRLKELLGEQGVNLVDVDVSDHSFEQQQQGTGDGEQSGSMADGTVTSDVAEEEVLHTNVQLDYTVDYFV